MKPRVQDLIDSMKDIDRIYIQPHNMPDPDAIASCFGLHELLKIFQINSKIIYISNIEKINSKTMIELFKIEMHLKEKSYASSEKEYVVYVDSQRGNSNITNVKGKKEAVIDHHNDEDGGEYVYKDIKEKVGACSTIITSYYKELGVKPSRDVATALLYGIMTDTNNLTRECEQQDLESFYYLYNIADMNHIKKLRMNEIGREDLNAYAKALETYEIYGNIGFVHIENCNDSLLGTISDMVYTIEGTAIVVSYAKRPDGIKFSVRSGVSSIHADQLVKFILDNRGVGGGHDEMAGGFISVEDMSFLNNKQLDTYVRYRAILFVEERICRK